MGPTNVQNTNFFIVSFGLDCVLSSDCSIPKKLGVDSPVITEGRLSRRLGGRRPFV